VAGLFLFTDEGWRKVSIIGATVKHKVFGTGTVTALTDEVVTVSFYGVERRFIYPDAFEKFLTFSCQELQTHIEEEILKRAIIAKRQKKYEQEQRARRQKLLNYRIAANSHLVVNVPCEQVDNVLQTLSFSTGVYFSGESIGMPRIADRVKPNSVCFITSCQKEQAERERMLVGAFMVAEDFFGDEAGNGIVKGHPKHHLAMPENQYLNFWELADQSAPLRWGKTAFRYCSAALANRMLSEMVAVVQETDQEEKSLELYQYFCAINQLRHLVEQKQDDAESR